MSLVAEKVNIKDFEASKLSFSEIKTAAKGKFVDVMYDHKPLSIQLPRMPVHVWQNNQAYGASENQVSIDLIFKELETRPAVAVAFKKLQEMDECICKEATSNAMIWGICKKNINFEAMKVFHHEMIRMPTNEKYHPAVKVKMYINKDSTVGCKVFDSNKQELKKFRVDDLRGASAAAVLHCTGVWVCAGRFSTAWRVSQLRVFEREQKAERVITDDDIVDFHTIDLSKVTYSAPTSMGGSGKLIYINYNMKPVVITTPKLTCPFGMSRYVPDNGVAKYSIDMSFKDVATCSDVKAFKDFIDSLDIKIPKDAVSNSWFKDVVYQPIAKQGNPEYPATIKFNLPTDGDVAKFKMHDDSGNEFDFDPTMIHDFKGAKVSCTVQCTGIWQNVSKFGVSFKVLKMSITPSASGNEKMDDEDDEEIVTPANGGDVFSDDDVDV